MKIYFGGAIRGGREKIEDYIKIVNFLEKYGEVLTKHVADINLSSNGENNLTEEEIYARDIKWLEECDIVVAEITVPSLGVGYELAYAEKKNKKIICLYEEGKTISAMIKGNKNFKLIPYTNIEQTFKEIEAYIK